MTKKAQIGTNHSEFQTFLSDRSNYWDQTNQLMIDQGWLSHDVATMQLLREMKNVLTIFVVRKSDDLLIGTLTLVVQPDFIYSNIFITRGGFRDTGVGIKMTHLSLEVLKDQMQKIPTGGRAVGPMIPFYAGPPLYGEEKHKMYYFRLTSISSAMKFFPAPTKHDYNVVSLKNLTFRQFQQLIDYDKMVTGKDRTVFMQNYYSLPIVKAVVLFDRAGNIKGMAGIAGVQTEPHLHKLSPLFAENLDQAGILVHSICAEIEDREAVIIMGVRNGSAGDSIITKCKEANMKMTVGTLMISQNNYVPYRDTSKTELVFAPTNSACHFDG